MNHLTVEIASEVTRRIRQHARAHMATEVCGVLIGEKTDGVLRIEALIEALNAAQGGTHVTFTQDAWETIYRVKDERYPDARIVGWYHSHPGFGVFLSDHDTFIHENFFSSPDQVAWVYDPHTDEEGCFGWLDGTIHRLSQLTIRQSGELVERTAEEQEPVVQVETAASPTQEKAAKPAPAWLRWTVTSLSYLTVLALGFVIAYVLFPHFVGIPVDPVTGQPLLDGRQAPAAPQPTDPGGSK
jgi:proteasome lid subunit RPN8/RPN11